MRSPYLAAVIALASCPVLAWAQGEMPAKPARPGVEQFLRIRPPGAPVRMPDGTMLLRDWPDGINQLYRVAGSEIRPETPRTKLTQFADGMGGFSVSPDGSTVLVTAAVGGNENYSIYRYDPAAAGASVALLADPKVQHAVNLWTRDGRGFVFSANDESPDDFYLYRYDLAAEGPGARRKLLGRPGSWSAVDATTDGTRLIVANHRSASDTSYFELVAASGELRDLTVVGTESPTVAVEPVGYMPGEQSVLYLSDVEGGLTRLYLRDLPTGAVTKPIAELDGVELDGARMNHERTFLAVVTNEDGYGVLHVYRLPGFERVALPPIEPGVIQVTDFRGDRISWSLSNARSPGLVYAATLGANPPTATQLTWADMQGIDLGSMALPELVKYPSFDGTTIPAFVYLPAGYRKGTPIPFVVNYHGGPEGQSRPSFNATLQFLVSEGFGVMQPNVRGSTGYGRAFHMMDDYKKRWDSVRDGVDGAQWLAANGYAKPGKMATYGGSYGGFMSVACLVEDGERAERGAPRLFGAGVDIVGIVNLKTFLEKTKGYRRKLREVEYGPLADSEFLASVSSINRSDKIRVPMFIAHGFNDPRVPVEEAMQLAVALKDRALADKDPARVPQLFIAPDEGHGFAKLDNRLYFGARLAVFLRTTIGKADGDVR